MSEQIERNDAAPEVCGTCRYHVYEPVDCDWICTCDESDFYSEWIPYGYSCECWEKRE